MENLKNLLVNFQYEKINFFSLFLLVCSFTLGNLIGIISKKINYNIFTIFFFNIIIEFINYLCYSSNTLESLFNKIPIRGKIKILLNIFKRGLLLGIFVEAFKLGS
uniref:Conserved protein Ycf20 n=1 Tax=Prototheca cutis TaxID=575411 RepID=A0A2Z6BES6_9CHLO|nr:conserved protein Ycf20 [Prototheca cutis]BBD20229.1 conserved protein Ycf20 [Prototheca cutis]